MPKESPSFNGQNIKTLVYQKLACGHKFHQNCIQQYLECLGLTNVHECFNHNIDFKCPMENCSLKISLKDVGYLLLIIIILLIL